MASAPFKEQLLILGAMKKRLEEDLRTFKRHIKQEESSWVIHQKVLIDICSFKEEWSRIGAHRDEIDIEYVTRLTGPALKRLRKWNGIERLRNTFLAHEFRDKRKGGNPASVDEIYFKSNVPTCYAEVMVLAEFCVYCCAVVINRHKEDHQAIVKELTFNRIKKKKEWEAETNMEFNQLVESFREHILREDPSLTEALGEHIPL